MPGTVVSIGEILWDVIGDRELLGGAPLNLAFHLQLLGHPAIFVSAVGADARGRLALEEVARRRLDTSFIEEVDGESTGIVDVRLNANGEPDFTIRRPAAYDAMQLDSAALERIRSQSPSWICHGTLFPHLGNGREMLHRLKGALPQARILYDVNLRRDCYSEELVLDLLAEASVVKLNDGEAIVVDRMLGGGQRELDLEEFCLSRARQFGWQAAAITRGAGGCCVLSGSRWVEAPGYQVTVSDTVGAGDAFAAALVHGLDCGWEVARIAAFGNALGALVASRPGGTPSWSLAECEALLGGGTAT